VQFATGAGAALAFCDSAAGSEIGTARPSRCRCGRNAGSETVARALQKPGTPDMLETIAIVLILLWLLGLLSSVTLGGFIHVLLAIALISIVARVIRGNRPVT
jgi:hypothetical protein